MAAVIQFDQVSKRYRLGQIGSGTLSHDLHRLWARIRGQDDPLAGVGDVNIPSQPKSLPEAPQTTASSFAKRKPRDADYVLALRDISFTVNQGEVLGVIGRNGAGKSTLLKLLARVTAPTSGYIHADGRIATLLEVGTGFHPELTGRENIFLNGSILGMNRLETANQLDAIVDFSGCSRYIDTPVKRYSSGMTARLGFAVAAHLQCDILVVDEVLAVGDADFQRRCIGRMKTVAQAGRTVLFVSHNMGSISTLCTRCALLDHGAIKFLGDTKAAVQQYLLINSIPSIDLVADPNSDFQFTRVRIYSDESFPEQAIPFDGPVTIEMAYTLRHPVDGLEIAVRVISSHGATVFTMHRSHSIDAAVPVGQRKVSVTIPAAFLTPGEYTVDLGAHISNQRLLDLRAHVISFRIEETGSLFSQFSGLDYGVVFCEGRWKDL